MDVEVCSIEQILQETQTPFNVTGDDRKTSGSDTTHERTFLFIIWNPMTSQTSV